MLHISEKKTEEVNYSPSNCFNAFFINVIFYNYIRINGDSAEEISPGDYSGSLIVLLSVPTVLVKYASGYWLGASTIGSQPESCPQGSGLKRRQQKSRFTNLSA
jgi:hypothetical protein